MLSADAAHIVYMPLAANLITMEFNVLSGKVNGQHIDLCTGHQTPLGFAAVNAVMVEVNIVLGLCGSVVDASPLAP